MTSFAYTHACLRLAECADEVEERPFFGLSLFAGLKAKAPFYLQWRL